MSSLKAFLINQVGTHTGKGKSAVNVQLLGNAWPTMYPAVPEKLNGYLILLPCHNPSTAAVRGSGTKAIHSPYCIIV